MSLCPHCQKSFPGARFCPEDGTLLGAEGGAQDPSDQTAALLASLPE
jgi:hypothetical protein